jgi:hypothetical protein
MEPPKATCAYPNANPKGEPKAWTLLACLMQTKKLDMKKQM